MTKETDEILISNDGMDALYQVTDAFREALDDECDECIAKSGTKLIDEAVVKTAFKQLIKKLYDTLKLGEKNG